MPIFSLIGKSALSLFQGVQLRKGGVRLAKRGTTSKKGVRITAPYDIYTERRSCIHMYICRRHTHRAQAYAYTERRQERFIQRAYTQGTYTGKDQRTYHPYVQSVHTRHTSYTYMYSGQLAIWLQEMQKNFKQYPNTRHTKIPRPRRRCKVQIRGSKICCIC